MPQNSSLSYSCLLHISWSWKSLNGSQMGYNHVILKAVFFTSGEIDAVLEPKKHKTKEPTHEQLKQFLKLSLGSPRVRSGCAFHLVEMHMFKPVWHNTRHAIIFKSKCNLQKMKLVIRCACIKGLILSDSMWSWSQDRPNLIFFFGAFDAAW